MKSDWKLTWLDPVECDRVHFRDISEDGKVLMEFSLEAPRYAKLYYALKDWFGDTNG